MSAIIEKLGETQKLMGNCYRPEIPVNGVKGEVWQCLNNFYGVSIPDMLMHNDIECYNSSTMASIIAGL